MCVTHTLLVLPLASTGDSAVRVGQGEQGKSPHTGVSRVLTYFILGPVILRSSK